MSDKQRISVTQMLQFLEKEEEQYNEMLQLMEAELVRLEMEEIKIKTRMREMSEEQDEENATDDCSSVDENQGFSHDIEISEENFSLSPVKSSPNADDRSNKKKEQGNENSESSDQIKDKEESTAVCNSMNKNSFLPCDSICVEETFRSNSERFTQEDLKKHVTNCYIERTLNKLQATENPSCSTDVKNSTQIEKMPLETNLQENEEQIEDSERKISVSSISVNGCFSPHLDNVLVEEISPSSLANYTPELLGKQNSPQRDISNKKTFQDNGYPRSSTDLQTSTAAERSESSMVHVRYLEPLILNPSHLEDDTLMEIEE